MSMLDVQSLKKVYTTRFGGAKVEALRNVNFTVEKGEYVASSVRKLQITSASPNLPPNGPSALPSSS